MFLSARMMAIEAEVSRAPASTAIGRRSDAIAPGSVRPLDRPCRKSAFSLRPRNCSQIP